jgi:hypothetical protein
LHRVDLDDRDKGVALRKLSGDALAAGAVAEHRHAPAVRGAVRDPHERLDARSGRRRARFSANCLIGLSLITSTGSRDRVAQRLEPHPPRGRLLGAAEQARRTDASR